MEKLTEAQKQELEEIKEKIADLYDQIENLIFEAQQVTGEVSYTFDFVNGHMDTIEELESAVQKVKEDETAGICGLCNKAIPRGRTRCDDCIRTAIRALQAETIQNIKEVTHEDVPNDKK